MEAGKQAVPGETSPEQAKRMEMLQKAEAAGRRRLKEYQSKKKAARRGGGRGDD
jgi:peptidyl-tRNA hydrolase ICT1